MPSDALAVPMTDTTVSSMVRRLDRMTPIQVRDIAKAVSPIVRAILHVCTGVTK